MRFSNVLKTFLAANMLLLTPMFAEYARANKRALYTQYVQKAAQQVTCSEIEVPSSYARLYKHKHDKKCGCSKEERVRCISQADFEHKGKNGIVIDQPGEYRIENSHFFCFLKRTFIFLFRKDNYYFS